jgi:hypothetical protein
MRLGELLWFTVCIGMRLFVLAVAVLVSLVAAQEEQKPVKDQIRETVDSIKGKVKSDAEKTAHDIQKKSKDFSDKIQSQSGSVFDTVFGFVKSVLSSVGDFFRVLFGDNSPAQPALAEPAAATLAEPRMSTPSAGTKAIVMSLLSAVAYGAWTIVGQYQPKTQVPMSYYRNLEENLL